jgi:outer membrane receptor protein involved in Fe transport
LIQPEGNDLVIEITDATLAFGIRNGVEKLNPAEGINKITVNKIDESSIRVRISGINQVPSAEVVPGSNLVLSVTPEGATTEQTSDEDIEVIATGEAEEEGYNVDEGNTATRTDTPLRDIPQSIQVVPQEVIRDRNTELVYQPSKQVALYTSFSRSFVQEAGFSLDGETFEPTRGTQYEIGVKTDLLENRLSATLAAYYLTKTNVTTPDPIDPDFSIQTGEQRSQGIELDVNGEILPGWNVTAAYAFTDAEVTEDNSIPEGNRLTNVPENQASIWTTYELQQGSLAGLGFGLGLFYVGEREGDLDNSFQLDDYLRTDAALYYRRDHLNAAINFRNLFNVDYFRASDEGDLFLFRGKPFTIVGSISWEF